MDFRSTGIDRGSSRAEAREGRSVPGRLCLPSLYVGDNRPAEGVDEHALKCVAFAAQIDPDWLGLRPGGAMFAVAPLFHITGLIGHVAAPLLAGAPTILTCRLPSRSLQRSQFRSIGLPRSSERSRYSSRGRTAPQSRRNL